MVGHQRLPLAPSNRLECALPPTLQYKFTAQPSAAGLPNATVTVASTKALLLGLSPLTEYTVSAGMGRV